jgi:hypothetical protein
MGARDILVLMIRLSNCDNLADLWHLAFPAAQASCACSIVLLPRRRLCPADKQGKRTFAAVMLDRLQRLAINKTNPDDLTPEEVSNLAETAAYRCV